MSHQVKRADMKSSKSNSSGYSTSSSNSREPYRTNGEGGRGYNSGINSGSKSLALYCNLSKTDIKYLYITKCLFFPVRFFLKTDQDVYIFVERILALAKAHESTLKRSLGGSCYQTAAPWRDPKTKYYASIRSYPQSTYPGFCSGTGYISTLDVARKIVETSPNIPFFHLEDVYLALLLRHVRYSLTRYGGFAAGTGVCKVPSRAKQTVTIHEVKPAEMRQLWASKCGL